MDSLFSRELYIAYYEKKIENEGEYFMETNFNAMMTAATDKYTQLIDIAYNIDEFRVVFFFTCTTLQFIRNIDKLI